MDTTVLFKYRSVTACMKASYELMSHHLTSLFKKTWWAMLIYAVFVAFTIYFRLPNKALHDWGEASPWSSYIIQTFIYLGVWVTGIISCAAVWVWLKKRIVSFRKTLIRFALLSILFDFILGLVLGGFTGGVSSFYQGYAAHAAADSPMIQVGAAAADGNSWMANGAIGAILGIVFIALMLLICIPFANIIPQVMLKEQGEKWNLWKSYKMGLRHFGGIFKMSFLGGIILVIILFVVSIPAMLLCWAQVASQLGALNGDPLGVPAYFPLLTFIVFTLTVFVISYAFTWLNISYVYLFGANKTLEDKKKEVKNEEVEMQK